MVFEDIEYYLERQNFAYTSVNIPNVSILRNLSGDRQIFCVLVDNTLNRALGTQELYKINTALAGFSSQGFGAPGGNCVLFIVVTRDISRDGFLAKTPDTNVWLADDSTGALIVYENQPSDFFGLRDGIEASITHTRTSQNKALSPMRKFPFVTVVLIALNVLYFIFTSTQGDISSSSYMLKMGADYAPYVFGEHQYWRLITSMFMHFSFTHLAGNMLYLAAFGYNLEKQTGRVKFLLIYMISGIGAGIVSCAFYYIIGENVVSAGASGAVYGLIGTVLYLTFKTRSRIQPSAMFMRFAVVIIFIFFSNVSLGSDVDGAAHIGGLIIGIGLSILFLGGKRNERR